MVKKMAVKTKSTKQRNVINFSVSTLFNRIAKVSVVAAVCFGIGMAVLKLPNLWGNIWPVEKIAIIGRTEHVDQVQLAILLNESKFGGMLSGDLEKLRSEVLDMPWVKNVQIRKVWPDTLSFDIDEFSPIAKVNQNYLIQNGSLVPIGGYVTTQPILTLDIGEMQIEQFELLSLLNKFKGIQTQLAGHKLNVQILTISENSNWTIDIENKFTIKIGRKQQVERIERFLQVYAAIENKTKIESVDLRYSNGLAVKLVDPKIAESLLNQKRKG